MMFTVLGEVNLWTFNDNVSIKNTDYGAFRYHDKRIDNLHEEGKRSYSQKRGMIYVPTNRKGNKLKDSIKYLEEQLKDNSAIYCNWYDHAILQLMLSNGLLIQIQVSIATGDIQKISFDKYFVGKAAEHISDVTITKNHLVCTYNDNQVTLVYFTKSKRHAFDKINKLEPKLSTIDLFGPNGRRLDKKIQVNKSGDLILIWWKSTINEVYPWCPSVKEHDRANIHLYHLTGTKLELICYIRTEFDPLCIIFDACHDNIIHSVEQKVSRKGEVTIEWRTYEVSRLDKLQRIAVISVPLPTHTSCVKFSPNQELLLLCCIDGSVTLYDQIKATSTNIKAAFIPTLASWHSDGIIFAIGNDRGQIQHFDISLSCIKSQIISEDTTAANILDLSSYFRNQPALLRMEWNKKTDLNFYDDYYNHGNSLFLLLFERGPVGVIKVIEGDNFSGDTLVRRYLSLSQIEQATSLLLSMNWDTYPRACMHSLNQISNYLFKLPLTQERENLIQNALGSFHVPIKPISQAIEEEYGDEVRDLTRRFFYHLLRYWMFEKAFRLAIDLNDHDLFMDLHFYALVVNDMEMATAAKEKAEHILSRSNSCSSSHSTCSRASCSICSDSTSDKGGESYSEESDDSPREDKSNFKRSRKYNYRKGPNSQIPPLPVLHPSQHNTKNLLSTSFNDVPSTNKNDCNIMSTSFNTSGNCLPTSTAFNRSSHISNTFFASTSFNKPSYKTHSNLTSTTTTNSADNTQFNNISDDLMTTSFGSLSINESKPVICTESIDNFAETAFNKSLNKGQYSFNDAAIDVITSLSEDNSLMSTPFNNPIYESISTHIPSDILVSSLDSIDNNIMSTSFSTLGPSISTTYNSTFNSVTSSHKSGTVSSASLQNSKPCDISGSLTPKAFTDTVGSSKAMPNFHSNNSNLVSTSFNYPEVNVIPDTNDNAMQNFNNEDDPNTNKSLQSGSIKKKAEFDVPPPPPSLTNSLSNYLQKLPKKNFPLSRSTSGLADIDEPIQKFSLPTAGHVTTRILQRQNSVSNISQNQYRHINLLPSKSYKFNYDLDYVPFHGSCDNINMQYATNNKKFDTLHNFHPTYNVQSKLLENRHHKLGSPPHNPNINVNKDTKPSSNIPPLPVITTSNSKTCSSCPIFADTSVLSNEKPKVKFSDTVTQILVPGTGQPHRQKRSTVTQLHMTDPKRELAESLPLCLGNEDYLKDFQPLSKDDNNDKTKESSKSDESAKIKVVHFGLL